MKIIIIMMITIIMIIMMMMINNNNNNNNEELAVPMAQSAANCRNTHTHVDRTHSLRPTHLHQHSYNHKMIIIANVMRHEIAQILI